MEKMILYRRFWLIPLLVWTVMVVTSLAWNINEAEKHNDALVRERADLLLRMVESVRLWNARHGGVYAPATEESPPNPHLDVEERDLTTPSGRSLTLINPAYMTRQLAEIVKERSGVKVHLTSRNPVNPNNRALPWEASALDRFEKQPGQESWSGFTEAEGEREFRYIVPLMTEKACMKCHEKDGYQVGDIRGGISVTFPQGPMMYSKQEQMHQFVLIHVAVWLIFSVLALFGLEKHRDKLLKLKELMHRQNELVAQRTAQLQQEVLEREEAQERLQRFIEASGEGLLVLDRQQRCTLCNRAALNILGYQSKSDVVGRDAFELLCPQKVSGEQKSTCGRGLFSIQRIANGVVHKDDVWFCSATKRVFPVEVRLAPVEIEGQVHGVVVTFSDVTERKRREVELRKLSQAVEFSPASTLITDAEGRIEYVNRQFTRTSGFAANEVLGRRPSVMGSGKTSPQTYRDLWQQIQSGKVWQGELLNRKKSGELFWEDVSISPILDPQGRISHFVAVKEDINQRKEQDAITWRMANYDSLTGLINRHHFINSLERHVVESERYQRCFGLLFIDLDGFKLVNDTYGHTIGDQLLKDAAQRMHEVTRASDTLARLGGDEFTVIMPDIDAMEAVEVVAEKLIDIISAPFEIDGCTMTVSASIGMTIFPRHAQDGDTLLNQADAGMYRAKEAGKNRACWYGL